MKIKNIFLYVLLTLSLVGVTYARNPGLHFSRYLDTNGDSTGTTNANGDYSVTPEEFYIDSDDVHDIAIYRLILFIEDTGSFDADSYGNGITLTNGVSIDLQDEEGNVITTLTNGEPIMHNAEWGQLTYDIDVKTWGTGNEILLARFSFSKFGGPVVLPAGSGLKGVVTLNDDFSGLVRHTFVVQGKYL